MTLIIPTWALVVLCILIGIRIIAKVLNSFRIIKLFSKGIKSLTGKNVVDLVKHLK